MAIQTYSATIQHDNGKIKLTILSQNGKQGAIQQIITVEGCPECAIVKLVKVKSKQIL